MARMTGGQALVQSLKREGVEVVFGLPGVQMDWAFDALYEERDAIRVIHTRHEQATSYMADGYARSTGKTGVCLMVPGPGLLNAAAGLSTAYATNSPVLCIAGQVPTHLLGKERGALHEIKSQLEAIGSVTKWAARAMRPEEVPGVVREAFRQLTTGRPRPVEIEIPQDTLAQQSEVDLYEPGTEPRPEGDPDLLERAAQLLGRAERPLIFAGGGVIGAEASEELRLLAAMLEAPVVMSQSGRGAVSDRHYLAHPSIAAYELLPKADVVLAVGTRFVMPGPFPWGMTEGQTLIHLDIDPEEVGRNVEPAVGVVADAKKGLAELLRRVPRHNRTRASREDEMAQVKANTKKTLDSLSPLGLYADAIRAELPDEGILVGEMTQVGYYANQGYPVYRPRTFITAGYQGTLGFGFPTALGVKVGNPDTPVVSIAGDGGFMYGVQELATMAQYGIGLVVVVFNDNAYGNVRRTQQTSFGGRLIASDLHNPDFAKMAETFGVRGYKAESPEALRKTLARALAIGEPALIEVPLGVMPNPFAAFAPPQDLLELGRKAKGRR
jgi:acetolactate synthase-1/2/3 large subunit